MIFFINFQILASKFEEQPHNYKPVSSLFPDEIKKLSKNDFIKGYGEHIKEFTKDQIKALEKIHIQALEEKHIKQLAPKQIPGLTTEQIKWLKPNQIKWLTQKQLNQFTKDQIQALEKNQIQAFNKERIEWLNEDKIQKFLPNQIKWLDPYQIEALNTKKLTKDQIEALEIEQLTSLSENQISQMEYYFSEAQRKYIIAHYNEDKNQDDFLVTEDNYKLRKYLLQKTDQGDDVEGNELSISHFGPRDNKIAYISPLFFGLTFLEKIQESPLFHNSHNKLFIRIIMVCSCLGGCIYRINRNNKLKRSKEIYFKPKQSLSK